MPGLDDDLERIAGEALRRDLLDHPQRFGFLPTRWFWNTHDINWRRVGWTITFAELVAMLVFWGTEWGFWIALFVVPVIAQGLFERNLRRRALAHTSIAHALVASAEDDEQEDP